MILLYLFIFFDISLPDCFGIHCTYSCPYISRIVYVSVYIFLLDKFCQCLVILSKLGFRLVSFFIYS